ncbi:mCG146024, partial [Mus musculus]
EKENFKSTWAKSTEEQWLTKDSKKLWNGRKLMLEYKTKPCSDPRLFICLAATRINVSDCFLGRMKKVWLIKHKVNAT